MRLIAILSAMILSAGTMSVPAFANTGENAGDGSTQAATVQTQETDSLDPDADYEEEDDSDFDYPMNDEDIGAGETGEDDSDYYDESGDNEPV